MCMRRLLLAPTLALALPSPSASMFIQFGFHL